MPIEDFMNQQRQWLPTDNSPAHLVWRSPRHMLFFLQDPKRADSLDDGDAAGDDDVKRQRGNIVESTNSLSFHKGVREVHGPTKRLPIDSRRTVKMTWRQHS